MTVIPHLTKETLQNGITADQINEVTNALRLALVWMKDNIEDYHDPDDLIGLSFYAYRVLRGGISDLHDAIEWYESFIFQEHVRGNLKLSEEVEQ